MMDVLHFLFEEDFTAVSEEHALSRSAIRDLLYSEMYGVPYNFKAKSSNSRGPQVNPAGYNDLDSDDSVEDMDAIESFSPRESKAKFVDSSTVSVPEQSFDMLDGPLG